MVSVVMITYGHDQFISQAIQGVLMQKCDFDIELIIANDCSPDNTDEVVKQIFKSHPNSYLINYTKHSENKGMMANFIWALQEAEGKYIALCEGDDYWTDPFKLQKQVCFLEENSNYSAVFHNVEQRWQLKEQSNLYLRNKRFQTGGLIKLDDLLGENIVPTCSLVFRKSSFFESKNKIPWSQLDYGDWPTVIILATNGLFYYLPIISGVRRMNLNSVWGLKDHKTNILKTIRTRKLIKETRLIDVHGLKKMEQYEFQLFLELHQIKEFLIFRMPKKGINIILFYLNKCSVQLLKVYYKKKFRVRITKNENI